MRSLPALVALACLSACARGPAEVEVGLGDLVHAPVVQQQPSRGGRALVALDRELGLPDSDVMPARRMAVRAEGGALRLPREPVWTGALVGADTVWVTTSGRLVIEGDNDAGAVEIDHDVIPEIAVRESLLAYAKRPGDDAGVYVVDVAAAAPGERLVPRLVTRGLAFADRPVFIDDKGLVVVGAVPSGIAGVHVAFVDGKTAPLAVTNAGLRTGHPLGPTFIPPPATHESMRVDVIDTGDGARRSLSYFDGAGLRTVELP